ncbi:MAG: DCC1-like thiol-disulfide oxidoreductase family protein [Schleiferiaceae bacterium]|jgi:predicted DCC family thiol-disulfide oxidoreductase YuxK|nr:DCC1-like thiol-disulfide oxidoreductase family protein [Schleiferiaceae bacterium]
MTKEELDFPVLLFDGVCNLCVGSVQFFLKHDKRGELKFASLQSAYGEQQKEKYNIPANVDSLIFIHKGKAYHYSSAALRGAANMGGLWPLVKVLLVIPPFVRNGIYKWIAKNRYRWFGKKESCWLPTPELNARFLDK